MADKNKVKIKIEVDAVEWLLHGDHEKVIPFTVPGSQMTDVCPDCGNTIQEHGLLAGVKVCPGDYIIDNTDGKSKSYKPADFTAQFE